MCKQWVVLTAMPLDFFTSLASVYYKIKLFMVVILLRGKFMFISVSQFQPTLTMLARVRDYQTDMLANMRVG